MTEPKALRKCIACDSYEPLPLHVKIKLTKALEVMLGDLPKGLLVLKGLGSPDGQCRNTVPSTSGCNLWPLVTKDGWCMKFRLP